MFRPLTLFLLFSIHLLADGVIAQTSVEVMTNQVRSKVHRRPHPAPFARFLKSNQERSELYRLIKEARSAGSPTQEVTRRIDLFLRAHLDADDMKEVEQLKSEGATLNARYSSHIAHK